MTVAERPAGKRARAREPLYRRKELHLLVGLIVAALTVAFASQRATDGARAQLDARLVHAGAGTDAGLVDIESEQLSAVRAISFTPGVAQDIEAIDGPALNPIVAPLQANSTVPMVDVVIPDGKVLIAVRSKGAPLPVRTRAGLQALHYALHDAHGPRGGRLSEVVTFRRSGLTLLTIGPVMDGNKAVGAVLAMTPMADVLGRLSQEVGTDLTAYDMNGNPVATTADFQPKRLPRDTARALIGGSAVETRYVYADHREKVGRLMVDHRAEAVLGVSLEDDSNVVGRMVALYAAVGLICTVLILATFWARVVNARRTE